jgi:hypothetical protein
VLVEQIPAGVQARLRLKTTSFVSLSYRFATNEAYKAAARDR